MAVCCVERWDSSCITHLVCVCKVDWCQQSRAFKFYTQKRLIRLKKRQTGQMKIQLKTCILLCIFRQDCRTRSVMCFFCYASYSVIHRTREKVLSTIGNFCYTFCSFKTQSNCHEGHNAPETCVLHLKYKREIKRQNPGLMIIADWSIELLVKHVQSREPLGSITSF